MEKRNTLALLVGMQTRFLKKLETELPYDPAIPLLGIHTEEAKTETNKYSNVHRSTVYNS